MKLKLVMFVALSALVATSTLAASYIDNESKTITKTREAVANAAPDDWKTLAKSAEKCIKKKVNLEEAKQWLEKSIEIKPTHYAFRIKGDYYASVNKPRKAINSYIESMKIAKAGNPSFDTSAIEAKIMKQRNKVY